MTQSSLWQWSNRMSTRAPTIDYEGMWLLARSGYGWVGPKKVNQSPHKNLQRRGTKMALQNLEPQSTKSCGCGLLEFGSSQFRARWNTYHTCSIDRQETIDGTFTIYHWYQSDRERSKWGIESTTMRRWSRSRSRLQIWQLRTRFRGDSWWIYASGEAVKHVCKGAIEVMMRLGAHTLLAVF